MVDREGTTVNGRHWATLLGVLALVATGCGDSTTDPAATSGPAATASTAAEATPTTMPPTTEPDATTTLPPGTLPPTIAATTTTSTTSTTTTTTSSAPPTTLAFEAPTGSFSVTGVASDDALNVRSGAGVEHEIVDRLQPNAVGFRTTGAGRVATDGGRWWEIELFDWPGDDTPPTGWVNAAFLRPDTPPCTNQHGVLGNIGVVVATPRSGDTVSSGFTVSGCSRTIEWVFGWNLYDRSGRLLASGDEGHGGGLPGPGTFEFTVAYDVPERQRGRLVVSDDPLLGPDYAIDTVIPLILEPGPGDGSTRHFAGPCAGFLDSRAVNSVILDEPRSGSVLRPGFTIAGCGNVFESEVFWWLHDETGNVLAMDHARAGEGEWEPFSGFVDYQIDHPQLGKVVVVEDDPRIEDDTQGFTPIENVIPVVLLP